MISQAQFDKEIELIIHNALREDVGEGDHSSMACIPEDAVGEAKLLVKEDCIIAGLAFAEQVFLHIDPKAKIEFNANDGDWLEIGNIAFTIKSTSQSILKGERLVLNAMQRMSAIATKT